MTLGQKLKKARKYAGLSQKQLGDKLQLSDKTISAYEVNRAEPSLDILQSIAEVTSTPIHYFFNKKVQEDAELKVVFERIERQLADVKKLLQDKKMV